MIVLTTASLLEDINMKLSVLALTPAVALSAFAAAVPVDRAVHPATPMSARHSLQARAPPASPNPKALLDLISATLNGNLKREEVADVDNIDEVADLPEEFIELLIFLLSHVKDEDLAGDIVSKRQDLGEVAEAAGEL